MRRMCSRIRIPPPAILLGVWGRSAANSITEAQLLAVASHRNNTFQFYQSGPEYRIMEPRRFRRPMRHLARYDLHFLPGLAGPTSYGVRLMAIVCRTNPARDVFSRRRVWLCDRYYLGLSGTDITPKLVRSRLYSCNPPRDRAGST